MNHGKMKPELYLIFFNVGWRARKTESKGLQKRMDG